MNFVLRPWKIDDLESLLRFANNFEIAKNMTNQFPFPYTEENGRNFIMSATKEAPFHILAIDISGEAAGGIGIHPKADIQCKNAELGYWLAQPYWGQGIATRAIIQMVNYGFENWDISRIYARPFGTNIASQKALEKSGFILEGKFEGSLFKNGEYLDELIYAIRRDKWETNH